MGVERDPDFDHQTPRIRFQAARWFKPLTLFLFPAFAPFVSASVSPRPAMNVPLKHHTVTFPDCRLHFDYPADLKPSPDFVMQKMATEVDYQTIRWVSPNASDAFILMRSDLRGHFWQGVLATLSIEMWLCTSPEDFTEDVSNTGSLIKALLKLSPTDGNAKSDRFSEIKINDRQWVLDEEKHIYSCGLNARIFIRARISIVKGSSESSKIEEWQRLTAGSVVSSLLVEATNKI